MFWRRCLVFTLILILAGCRPKAPGSAPFPTPAALSKSTTYWDMGISVQYGDLWPDVQYSSGQALFTTDPNMFDANKNILHPLIALKLVDPVNQLGLSANASLNQIAVSALGTTVNVTNTGAIALAGLDGNFVEVDEPSKNIHGESVALRLPDGRVGVMISLALVDQWSDFAPIMVNVQDSMKLVKPSSVTLPQISNNTSSFPQGGLTLTLPTGWSGQPLNGNSLVFRAPNADPFADNSGFANGPQLIIYGQPITGGDPKIAFGQIIGAAPSDPINTITVGGQPAYQIDDKDNATGQVISFVGVPSQDRTIISVFRWTTPYILSDVMHPTLTGILGSVKFGAISVALAPSPTPSATPIIPTPNESDFAGIPQSQLADKTLILGNPDAPIHLVEFTDFSCLTCLNYTTILREFIALYVRTGKARIEYRYLTNIGHVASTTAAYAALCAEEQGKAMEMSDWLFFVQVTQGAKAFTVDNIASESVKIGVDGIKLRDCINSGRYADTLKAADDYQKQIKLRTVPAILVATGTDTPVIISNNGQLYSIPTYDMLSSTVDAMLAAK